MSRCVVGYGYLPLLARCSPAQIQWLADEYVLEEAPICDCVSPDDWVCTRAPGHTDFHIAHAVNDQTGKVVEVEIVAVWHDDATDVRPTDIPPFPNEWRWE